MSDDDTLDITLDLARVVQALRDCAALNCARRLYNQPRCGECTICRAKAAIERWDARG